MHRALCCIVASALGALSVTAAAQDYPVKPIRFLVPSPAGGSPDLLARSFGSRLSARWATRHRPRGSLRSTQDCQIRSWSSSVPGT